MAYISHPSHAFRGWLPSFKGWNWRLLFVLAVNTVGWLAIGKLILAAF